MLPFRGCCLILAIRFCPAGVTPRRRNRSRSSTAASSSSMIIGYPTGGSNDIYARAVARHIGKHIPGNPTVIPRNMPGGGSLIAANHVFNVAPKDGTVLSLIAPTIPLEERLGVANVKLRTAEFNWIGRVAPSVNVTFVMASVPVKTIQDTFKREVILGASARSSTVAVYPAVVANVTGAKFRIVLGYPSSTASMLAMERGEVEGHSTSLEVIRAVASRLAAGARSHAARAICAQSSSRTAGCSDVVGTGRKTMLTGRSCGSSPTPPKSAR